MTTLDESVMIVLRGLQRSSARFGSEALAQLAQDGISPEVLAKTLQELADQPFHSTHLGIRATPSLVSQTMAALAERLRPSSILDPTCGTGQVLLKVSQACDAGLVHGVDTDAHSAAIAQAILGDRGIVFSGDVLDADLPLSPAYDLIVADAELAKAPRLDSPLANSLGSAFYAHHLAVWACDKLSETGVLAILMGPGDLRRSRFIRWIDAVHAKDCAIRASLHVPAGTRSDTKIPTQIVIITRGKQDKLFVAEASHDPVRRKRILDNYKKNKSDDHLSLGRMCDLGTFIGFEPLEAESRLKKMVSRHAKNIDPITFDKLVLRKTRHPSPKEAQQEEHYSENAIYFPYPGLGFYTSASEVSAKFKRWTVYELDPDAVDARYLCKWFASSLGRVALEAAGSVAPGLYNLSADIEKRLKCYLPGIEGQRKVMGFSNKLESLRMQLHETDAAYWNGEISIRDFANQVDALSPIEEKNAWMQSLPFPLASILWRHETSPNDPRIRLPVLLHFFEALAAFLANIHLSAFQNDRPRWRERHARLNESLEGKKLSFSRATFGTWRVIVDQLGSAAREMFGDKVERGVVRDAMYFCHDEDFLDALFDKRLSRVLADANTVRNEEQAHGGAMGATRAQSLEDELMRHLSIVRLVFGQMWRRYPLLQAGSMERRRGLYRVEVEQVMGTQDRFRKTIVDLIGAPETGELFLLGEGEKEGLNLLPLLRVMKSPDTPATACYFYNRQGKKGQDFVSYHFERESRIEENFEDTASALLALENVSA